MRSLICVLGVLASMFLGGRPADAQQISVGVKGGIRATNDVNGTLKSESKRYIVGPSVEIGLPMRLSVEADALYRPFGFTGTMSSCCASSTTRERANSWEFPIILKYRFPGVLVHPFVGVGYAPRIVHGTDISSGSYLSGMSSNPPMDIYTSFSNVRTATNYSVAHGVVASAGLSLGAGPVRFTPEVRYEHWNAPFLNQVGGDGSYRFESKQDEVLVLLGISWH